MSDVTRDALHYMLKAALIEIRASDDLEFVKKVADVFHGLPMALLTSATDDDYSRAFANVVKRSERWGFGQYVYELKDAALKNASSTR